VSIDLPRAWLGMGSSQDVLAEVLVGLCPRCAREVQRRVHAMREAHGELARALEVIDVATQARSELEKLDEQLAEAEGAVAFQRRRADGTEAALVLMALAYLHERGRAVRAEAEFRVVMHAYVQLLQAAGSTADEQDARLDLGLAPGPLTSGGCVPAASTA
jgi:hypothetical protein